MNNNVGHNAQGNGLAAELATDTLDAERYRWLRDHCTAMENPSHTWIVEAPGELWDDAIDAAMVANAKVTCLNITDSYAYMILNN